MKSEDLLYVIEPEDHNEETLIKLLNKHQEIRFVSLAGVDLVGLETEEKIPVRVFLNDLDEFLHGIAAQSDGSSFYFPNIATLDNAKIDMKADLDRNWFVDYNFEHIDSATGLPVGTLKIPCFLFHDGKPIDSRHALLRATAYTEERSKHYLSKNPAFKEQAGFEAEDIEAFTITAATELEFWAMTPQNQRDRLELYTSQGLNEQYWAGTRGAVRTALEETLIWMDRYGLEPEMGHKEVGGVNPKLNKEGSLTGIMEQLEVAWKYSDALQAADNEIVVKRIIQEVFRKYGMDVTFLAKPVDGVAGSGEHTHIGLLAQLANGERVNLFHSLTNSYLSPFGYGAIMGILKHYEVINPFVTASNEAFKRLKKGFEAPVATVTSLGRTVDVPSRNRSVLLGLVRDTDNPLATRFELRSPHPHTNTYLCLTTMLLAMLDGIAYALESGKTEEQLLEELSKEPGEEADYLEQERSYRSEKDIFEDYTEEEREAFFGSAPQTVFENIQALERYPEKTAVLLQGDVLTEALIDSFKAASIDKWVTEIEHRIIPRRRKEILEITSSHDPEKAFDFDLQTWNAISKLKSELAKDTKDQPSLFTDIIEAIHQKDYTLVSDLQLHIMSKMDELRNLYQRYKNNLIE